MGCLTDESSRAYASQMPSMNHNSRGYSVDNSEGHSQGYNSGEQTNYN